jgi:ParB-like chromosome segregation protein Spo0J
MNNELHTIPLDRLVSHPDNPNRMSKANFDKLVRNIERSGRYEPLVVRPCPDARRTRIDGRLSASPCPESQCASVFQIINGHHRWQALKQLGHKSADVVIWDIDDHQTDILLATLNRLGGSDSIEKKLALLKRLNEQFAARELAKLLPVTAKQIERLTTLKLPSAPATVAPDNFAEPMVFFVAREQKKIIDQALSLASSRCLTAEKSLAGATKAEKKAAALAVLAQSFLADSTRKEMERYFEAEFSKQKDNERDAKNENQIRPA